MPAPTLETDRLLLSPFAPEDLDVLHRHLSDAQVMRYYPSVLSREGSEMWLDRILRDYAESGFGMLAVRLKETAQFIGQAGIMRRIDGGGTHHYLAYLLCREFWDFGYATEAARRLLEFGFEQMGLELIEALVRPENLPSVRVVQRLGMRAAGVTEHAGFHHDVYAVRREAWRRARC